MLEKVLSFPNQMAEAFTQAKNLTCPSELSDISRIVTLGMGGSGIVGDFVRVLLRNSETSVHVNKHATKMRSLNRKDLVLAITYSGRTRETLDAMEHCAHSEARMICITSNRDFGQFCNSKNIECIIVPENGQTRSSFGYLLVPTLCILKRIGAMPNIDSEISEAISVLENIRKQSGPDVPPHNNPVSVLAHSLTQSFPVIYGEDNFTDAPAIRWKQLLNENSKTHCYNDTFPELLHNEIEAWNGMQEISKNSMYSLILLRDSIYESETHLQEKIEATKRLVQENGARVFEFHSQGQSELARLLSLSYLGDFASVYLAAEKSFDAASINNIELIKKITW